MVQTFRGNYEMTKNYVDGSPKKDAVYFGTFFFADNDVTYNGQKVAAGASIVDGTARSYTAAQGAYDRDPYTLGVDLPLFAFDFDGVQGAIKEKGDARYYTFHGVYNFTVTFVDKSGNGYSLGADQTLSATEIGYRNSRGTWRYQVNKEAGMANSRPITLDDIATGRYSKVDPKYTAGGEGAGQDQVDHKSGSFNIGGATKII
jgi:hypothetical protein